MAKWTFDDGAIRFGDGGPGLGGFLPDSAQVVVTMHNTQVAGLCQQLADAKREHDECWQAVYDACTWFMDGPRLLTIAERIRQITRTMTALGTQRNEARQQLAERDAALAQEHAIAGEAMAWVEFLREALVATATVKDAIDIRAWENAIERARATLAECDPSKTGSTHPRPLREAYAALAGMRQVLEAAPQDGQLGILRRYFHWRQTLRAALATDAGRDRLALEREIAEEARLAAAALEDGKLAKLGLGAAVYLVRESLGKIVKICEKVGLP